MSTATACSSNATDNFQRERGATKSSATRTKRAVSVKSGCALGTDRQRLGAASRWRFAISSDGCCASSPAGASRASSTSSHRIARRMRICTRLTSVALFGDPALLLLFRVPNSRLQIRLQTFLPSALNAASLRSYGKQPLPYLFSSAPIVIGGFLTVRTSRHDRRRDTALLCWCGVTH